MVGGTVLRQAQDDGWGARMKSIKMRLPGAGPVTADKFWVMEYNHPSTLHSLFGNR